MAYGIIPSPLHAALKAPTPALNAIPDQTPTSLDPAVEDQYIHQAATETGLSPDLIRRVMMVESSGKPDAESPLGASYGEGLMQLSEAAAKDMGVTNRKDPRQSILGGARYLKRQIDAFGGDVDLGLAAYNAGPEKVKEAGGVPASTADYIRKVTGKMPTTTGTDTSGAVATASKMLQTGLSEQEKSLAGYDAALPAARKANEAFVKGLDESRAREEGIAKRMDQIHQSMVDARMTLGERPKMPDYQPPQPKDAMKMLAGALPMLLLTSGSMGRNKGLALMKSMSGMLEGVNEGNEETRKHYQEDFRAKTEAVLHQAELDHQRYMEIFDSLKTDATLAMSQAEVFAHERGIDELKLAAQNFDMKAFADRAHMSASVAETAGQVLQWHEQSIQRAFDAKIKMTEAETARLKVPPATQAYNDAYTQAKAEGKSDEDARAYAAEESGKVSRQTRSGELMAEAREEDAMAKQFVAKGSVGEAYQAASVNAAKIADAARNPTAYLTPAGTAIVADTFTRAFNGGNAIRGFQAKMLSDDRSVANMLRGAVQKYDTGGKYTAAEIEQMAKAVQRIMPELKSGFADAAKDQVRKATGRGLNPRNAFPSDLASLVAPYMSDGGAAAPASHVPTSDDVEMLRRNPDAKHRAWFDEAFGAGAAAQTLGD